MDRHAVIEARVMADYRAHVGREVLVRTVSGYVGMDSVEVHLDPPARMRIDSTPETAVKRWCDDWCDPYWDVTLVEPHPQLVDVRSMWMHGPSHHLDGIRSEGSDLAVDATPDSPPAPGM